MNEKCHLQHNKQSKFSLKLICNHSGAPLTCCFEFQGAVRLRKNGSDNLSVKQITSQMITYLNHYRVPPCLQKQFDNSTTPFILEKGVHYHQSVGSYVLVDGYMHIVYYKLRYMYLYLCSFYERISGGGKYS